MTYKTPEIKKFKGLFVQPNSLTVPEGALETAHNVVIQKDDVISKMKGAYLFWTPPAGKTIRGAFVYRETIFVVCNDALYSLALSGTDPNKVGTETLITGESFTVAATRRPRVMTAGKAAFFTTDNGVMKIETVSGPIRKAGAPPALDCRAFFLSENGGVVGNAQVGYRILFGRRDANRNLILSAPSDAVYLTNVLYTGTWSRDGADKITVETGSVNHPLVDGMSFTLVSAAGADAPTINTDYTVLSRVDSNTFTVTNTGPLSAGGACTFTVALAARLEASIPTEITSTVDGYFFQVYRTTASNSEDAEPSQDFKLVDERALTTAEIARRFILYDDVIDELFLGEQLYTNPNTKEGEAQANNRPPLCDDIAAYKNHAFYANCTSRHLLNINLVSSNSDPADPVSIVDGDYVQLSRSGAAGVAYATTGAGPYTVTVTSPSHGIATNTEILVSGGSSAAVDGARTIAVVDSSHFTFTLAADPGATGTLTWNIVRRYVARNGVANDTVLMTGAGTATITFTYTGHDLDNGDVVYISGADGTPGAGEQLIPDGEYTVSASAANTFQIVAAAGDIAATAYITGRRNISGYWIFQLVSPATAGSVAVGIRETAVGLVRAINRDPSSVIYANYVSQIGDVPGLMRWQAKDFGGAVTVISGNAASGACFSPELPTSGVTVSSQADADENGLFISKLGLNEAVPLANKIPVDTTNNEILRVAPLQDTMMALTEAGLFRVDGSAVENFEAVPLDKTMICVAPNSMAIINNTVTFLSTQGVCQAASNSVRIVSRDIEPLFKAVVGSSAIDAETCGMAYETERLYILTTLLPRGTAAATSYVFNNLSAGWSTWENLAKFGFVGPDDMLYFVSTGNVLMRQRKNHTKIDYCAQNYTATVVSIAADGLSGVVTVAVTPQVGDILVKSDVITRVTAVAASGADWALTFQRMTNLAAADTPILYQRYAATVKLAPYHGGKIGLMKQFAAVQIHQRSSNITLLDISFAGQVFGSSLVTRWDMAALIAAGGFGMEPWGMFAWGEESTIDEVFTTQPAPVIRTLVPELSQRTNFIQLQFEHFNAGEPLDIQGITFAVKPYRERVSR